MSLRSLWQPAWGSHQPRGMRAAHRCGKFGEGKVGVTVPIREESPACAPGCPRPSQVMVGVDTTVHVVSKMSLGCLPSGFLGSFQKCPCLFRGHRLVLPAIVPPCGWWVTGSPWPPPESRERPRDVLLSARSSVALPAVPAQRLHGCPGVIMILMPSFRKSKPTSTVCVCDQNY